MRIFLMSILCLLMTAGFTFAQDEKPAEKPAAEKPETAEKESPFKTLKDRSSYGIGQNLAAQIKFNDQLELNFEIVIEGFADSLRDKESKMTERQIQEAMIELQAQLRAAAEEKQKMQFAEAIKAGKEFLEKNAKREGVKTTKSGLQGTLLDGTVFDSSVDRGEPIDFGVGGVIKGWTEALQLMTVGDKYKLYVPSDLAYGARGAGQKIGPHTTLIFEVELLAINGEK